MKRYAAKFAGYILIALAIALLTGPFTGYRAHMGTQRHENELCRQYPESCERQDAGAFPEMFQAVKYAGGVLFLFGGIFLLRKSRFRPGGIAVNPPWAALGADAVSVFFLAFAAYCVWAEIFDVLWHVKSYLYAGNEAAMKMIALFFVPAAAVMAFFVSNFSGQSIVIDAEGITIHYPGGSKKINWKKIKNLEIRESRTLTGGEEFPAPRTMQKILHIEGEEISMDLYEPGREKTKKRIVETLTKYAPDTFRKTVSGIGVGW